MVREELEKLTGFTQKDGEKLDNYKKRLVQEADSIIGDDTALWKALSKETQTWMNQAVVAIQSGAKAMPEFPEVVQQLEQPPAKETKKTKPASKPKEEPPEEEVEKEIDSLSKELTAGEEEESEELEKELEEDGDLEGTEDPVEEEPAPTPAPTATKKKAFPKKEIAPKNIVSNTPEKAKEISDKTLGKTHIKTLTESPTKQTSAVKYIWEIVCLNPDISLIELKQKLNSAKVFASEGTIKSKRNDARVIIKILIEQGRYKFTAKEKELMGEKGDA